MSEKKQRIQTHQLMKLAITSIVRRTGEYHLRFYTMFERFKTAYHPSKLLNVTLGKVFRQLYGVKSTMEISLEYQRRKLRGQVNDI